MIAPTLAGGLLSLACGVALVAQQPSFSTRTESVRVDVLVTDRGRVVDGLGPADFELRDEGVPQQLDLATFERIPLNIVVALDTSGSVSGARLEHLRGAARALLDGLHEGDRAAILTFDSGVSMAGALSEDRAALTAALDSLAVKPTPGAGATTLFDAAYSAMVLSEAAAYRPLVVIFSDGVDIGSWLTHERVLDASRRLDVVVYGVTVAGSGDTSFLRDLITATAGDLLAESSIDRVRSAFIRILAEFRSRYLLSYSPRGVSSSGWHRLEVRVKGRRATVKARPGYLAGS